MGGLEGFWPMTLPFEGKVAIVQSVPLIAVRDVPASSAWYQRLFGCSSDMEAGHPHRQEFDRIVDGAGQVLIGFHAWNAEPETPMDRHFANPDDGQSGHGVVLGFTVEDLDQVLERARVMGAEFVGETATYPDRSRGQLVRDPDGYMIQLSSPRQS